MRGIRIGVLYDLKDKLSGGLGKIKERMGKVNELQKKARLQTKEYFNSFSKGIKDSMPSLDAFSMKNTQLFDALSDQFPMLGRLGGMLANPFVLGLAAVTAMVIGVAKLGSHMADVTRNITPLQQSVTMLFDQTGKEMENTTAQILAISRVTKTETGEITKSANALTKEYEDMGATARDSLNAIQTGLIATNGALDLEEVKEYASQMRDAGLSMSEFVALSIQGKKQGIWSDKAPDTVKEFNLRLKEMTPAAMKALQGIGISSDAILKGLDDGSLKTLDVLRQVSKAMANASTQARQTIIADLFAGSGEDAGKRFLLALGEMDLSMKAITSSMTAQQQHQLRQIQLNEKLAQQQQRYTKIIQPILNWWEELRLKVMVIFNQVLANAMEWFREQWDKLKPPIMAIWQILKIAIAPAVLSIIVLFKGLGTVIGWVASMIRGIYNTWKTVVEFIGRGIQWIYEKMGGEGNIWSRLFEGLDRWRFKIKTFFEDLGSFASKVNKLIEAGLERDPKKIKEAYEALRGFQFRDSDALYQAGAAARNSTSAGGFTETFTPPRDAAEGLGNGSIAAGTHQQRNVTVNIQNLNEGGINLTTSTVAEAAPDLEDAFVEMLIKAVRDVEQTL